MLIFAQSIKSMINNHISITGDLGSGKSSVAKWLSERLPLRYFSTGEIQRELSRQKGLNTLEMNLLAENDLSIDDYIDEYLKNINKGHERFILDSRMAWHFVEDTFKIYLWAHPSVAAARVIADKNRKGEPVAESREEVAINLIARRQAEDRRFKQIYGVSCDDLTNYDLVIDASHASIETIAQLIESTYLGQKYQSKYLFSPKSIFPMPGFKSKLEQSLREESSNTTPIVKIWLLDKNLFLTQGLFDLHKALTDRKEYIPVVLESDVKEAQETLEKSSPDQYLKELREWESIHSFTFAWLPVK